MESSKRLDMNVVGSSVPGVQAGIATMPTPSGKTQTGRIVQCEAAAIQMPPRKMAVTLNTSQRTATDYVVTVTSAPWPAWETVYAEKSRTFEIQECEYKPTTDKFQKAVQGSLSNLEKIWQVDKKNPVSFCMAVVIEIDQLKKDYKLDDVESEDHKFMACQLGPYYADSLRPALETIKSQVDNECGWEYHMEIGLIGKYLQLPMDKTFDTSSNKELLKEIYLELLDSELCYLEFMKNSPFKRTANYSCTVIGHLLSRRYGAQGYRFISEEDARRINEKKDDLIQIIKWNLAKGGADKNIDRLKDDIRRGTADITTKLAKRRYNDMLKEIFEKKKEQYHQWKYVSTEECLSFLNELFYLFVTCTSKISELHLLPNNIATEITRVIKLQLNNHLYRSVRLEERLLKFIEKMLDKKVVSEKFGKLCLYCKELEFPPKDVVAIRSNDKISGQLKDKLAEIRFTSGNKLEAQKAADKLKQLLHEHGHEIEALSMESSDNNFAPNIRKRLYKELFMPLIEAFYKHQNQEGLDKDKFADAMRLFRPDLVELSPYTFVLTNEKERADLTNVACAAWYCDIERLSQTALFREEDVDCLLELKHVSPHIPDQPLRAVLEKALVNLSKFLLYDLGEIPIEKIETLSQWVDGLDRVKRVDEQLKRHNENRQKVNEGAVSKRDMVSPDIPSTSVPVFDIGQAASKSVALKRKSTTARVAFDQSVPDAALSQPESEEPSTFKKSKSSFAPAPAEKE